MKNCKRIASFLLVIVLAFSLIPCAMAINTPKTPDSENSTNDIFYTSCPSCAYSQAVKQTAQSGQPTLVDGFPHEDHLDYYICVMVREVIHCPICGYFSDQTTPIFSRVWCPLNANNL